MPSHAADPPLPRIGCSRDDKILMHMSHGICVSNRGAPSLEGIKEENRMFLSACFEADRSSFAKGMRSINCASCDVHDDGMNVADMLPHLAEAARRVANEAGKDGVLFVLISSAGKFMRNGELAIQGTAGRWAGLDGLIDVLAKNIGDALAVLLVSAIEESFLVHL